MDSLSGGGGSPAGDAIWVVVVGRLLLACLAGCVVARLAIGRRRGAVDDTMPITLVLMSVLIAMATQIIGDNVARAFSLVGALSIVRFRTALPETQDVAFILTAVVVGMAIGAGQYAVAAIGLVVVGGVMLATAPDKPLGRMFRSRVRPTSGSEPAGLSDLCLTIGPSATEEVDAALVGMCESLRLTNAESIKRGAALRLEYQIRLRPEWNSVLALTTLQRLPAVESVQLRCGQV